MHSHYNWTGTIGMKIGRLNPCCNGRCTRTYVCKDAEVKNFEVLILVVMEDALALCNENLQAEKKEMS